MHSILVIGAGKIGALIAFLLAHSKSYQVYLADIDIHNPNLAALSDAPHIKFTSLDASNSKAVSDFLKKNKVEAIVSSLPYYCNVPIAKLAATFNLHYFDLTEDIKTTEAVRECAQAKKSAFVPQCGLAPGFISIVAHDLMQQFSTLDTVKMRVGALPQQSSNMLHYSLTWSTDGLINEYGNPCQAIWHGKETMVLPLEGQERMVLDGLEYEAFNTSGGVGSLIQSYLGKVRELNYKTVRYPGHCEKIRFLMNDLKLNEDRDTLKRIFEHALPKTYQDLVLVYVAVTGTQAGEFVEKSYMKKFYSQECYDQHWTAIQLTTASGICAVVDLVFADAHQYHGFIHQEQFSFALLSKNRFGRYFVEAHHS